MRVTIATGPCLPYPAIKGGGMIRVWQALAPYFVQAGHEVTILARSTEDQNSDEVVDQIRILRQGGFDQSSCTALNLVRDFFYAWESSRKLPPADILITNDFWMPYLTPRLNKLAGNVVVSVNRFPKHQMFLYRKAALLVTPTNILKEVIQKQTPRIAHQVVCIPNPYEAAHFSQNETGFKKPNSILYVGRVHPEKGIEILIDSFKEIHRKFPDAHLSIVGPHLTSEGGAGLAYLNKLKSLAEDFPITFHSPIFATAELAHIYQQHSIFCYPVLADSAEAMCIAPIEAMACGCVPVVSNNPAFSNWINPEKNGLVFYHQGHQSAINLADKIQRLLENPALCASMRAQALVTVKNFTPQTVAKNFLAQFETILHESS